MTGRLARPLIVAAAVGLLLGLLSIAGDTPSPYLWWRVFTVLGNIAAPWTVAAFLMGHNAKAPGPGALAGAVAMVVGIVVYLPLLLFRGDPGGLHREHRPCGLDLVWRRPDSRSGPWSMRRPGGRERWPPASMGCGCAVGRAARRSGVGGRDMAGLGSAQYAGHRRAGGGRAPLRCRVCAASGHAPRDRPTRPLPTPPFSPWGPPGSGRWPACSGSSSSGRPQALPKARGQNLILSAPRCDPARNGPADSRASRAPSRWRAASRIH